MQKAENRVHHCPDYKRCATVRAGDVYFPVRQFDFSPWSGHRCIKPEMREVAKSRGKEPRSSSLTQGCVRLLEQTDETFPTD